MGCGQGKNKDEEVVDRNENAENNAAGHRENDDNQPREEEKEQKQLTTTDNGFPTTADDVTAAWLSKQLDEPVDTFTMNKVGQGFTADAFRICYNDGKTVIIKLPSALGEAKQKVHAKDCTVEVMFYRDFAPKLAGLMKLPKVYATL